MLIFCGIFAALNFHVQCYRLRCFSFASLAPTPTPPNFNKSILCAFMEERIFNICFFLGICSLYSPWKTGRKGMIWYNFEGGVWGPKLVLTLSLPSARPFHVRSRSTEHQVEISSILQKRGSELSAPKSRIAIASDFHLQTRHRKEFPQFKGL